MLVIENHLKRFMSLSYGWGMGYVLLPYNHPFHGLHYDNINVNIHGGLTFGRLFYEKSNKSFLDWVKDREIYGDITIDNFQNFENYWIIGFDTNHLGDDLNNCSKNFVIKETENLLDQCLNDEIEGIKKYKKIFLRKDKLKDIDASVLALSSKQ